MIGNNAILAISTMIMLRLYLACGEDFSPEKYMYVYNDSNETIYYWYSCSEDTISTIYIYNHYDWQMPKEEYFYKCEAFQSKKMEVYLDDIIPSSNYQVLFITEKTLRQYTKEELKENDIYDKRIIISYDVFSKKNQNLEIHYP